MAEQTRFKNAIREHYVGVFDKANPEKEPTEWLLLAEGIFTVEDDSEDTVEEYADYAGDGTLQEDITGLTESYNFEGQYYPANKAQSLIAGLKRKTGDDRKVWHKIISANKKKEIVGVSTASNIIAGAGEASEYETFSCRLAYTSIAKEREHTPAL